MILYGSVIKTHSLDLCDVESTAQTGVGNEFVGKTYIMLDSDHFERVIPMEPNAQPHGPSASAPAPVEEVAVQPLTSGRPKAASVASSPKKSLTPAQAAPTAVTLTKALEAFKKSNNSFPNTLTELREF